MNTKKLIGTSMIALLVVALSVSMAAAAMPDIGACDSNGDTKTMFDDADDVYVKGQGIAGDSYTVYVMPDQTSWDGTEDLAADNMAKITVTVDSTGLAFSSQPILIWAGTQTIPEEYDLVLDTNNNGVFDWGDDVEDGMEVGFTIVPEFATLAIPVVALLGLVLFMRRKKD